MTVAVLGVLASVVFGSQWWAAARVKRRLLVRLIEAVCDVAVREVEAAYVQPTKIASGEWRLSAGNQAIAQERAELDVRERLADVGVRVPYVVRNGAVREGVKQAVERMQGRGGA